MSDNGKKSIDKKVFEVVLSEDGQFKISFGGAPYHITSHAIFMLTMYHQNRILAAEAEAAAKNESPIISRLRGDNG